MYKLWDWYLSKYSTTINTLWQDISEETSSVLKFLSRSDIKQNCDCRDIKILLIVKKKNHFKQRYRLIMSLNYFKCIFKVESIHAPNIAGIIMNMKLNWKYCYFLRSGNLSTLLRPSHCKLQYNEHFRHLMVPTKVWTMQFHDS